MRVDIYKSEEEQAKIEAMHLADLIHKKDDLLLCVPAGQSCVSLFKELIAMNKSKMIDFSKVKFVGLDEWCNYDNYEGSAGWILDTTFFNYINVNRNNMRLFNPNPKDPEQECDEVEQYISDNGGIDYIALGVGMNGHVALNEPGVDFNVGAHVNKIADKTKEVSAKYFKDGEPILKVGLTLGYKDILAAKEIVVFLNGTRKAPIFEKLMKTPITNDFPSTNIKASDKARISVDATAAQNIFKF